MFKEQITNVPKSIIPGRIATIGHIKHQYLLFGSTNILFVGVKLKVGTPTERLDAIARVIAEADGESSVLVCVNHILSRL